MVKTFIFNIGGSDREFELEHRIFNVSSFLLTTFAALGAVGNYFTGLHPMTVWLSLVGFIFSGCLYYRSRFKGNFSIKISFSYILIVVGILGSMFFFNGGTQGTILYLIIMLLNVFLLIVPTSYQNSVSVILYGLMVLIILLEFFFPGWVVPYHSFSEMIVDHIISIFYSVFYTSVVIVLFRRKHIEDRERIIEQKNELELKTKQLQVAIESAEERNSYIELLLRELNHRVKNNLQLVSSLLQKQANLSNALETKSALIDTKHRMLSLILLHQRLYGADNSTSVFMPSYLKELTESILLSNNEFKEENIFYDIDDVRLNVESGTSIGLIANELITNACKHAFEEINDPCLFVVFKKRNNEFSLTIKDNGKGIISAEDKSSFGMELISILTKQLKGTFVSECTINQGCSFTVTFKNIE